jgi:lysophospholipase L1-like esterase
MNFSTPVKPAKPDFQIHYGMKMISMGSCFSENIGKAFQKYKFDILINPFGQQYNPLSIAYAIDRICHLQVYTETELVQHHELYHSFDHHSDFSKPGLTETKDFINANLVQAHEQLKTSDVLFLTFGTAHVFSLPETEKIVSNCHKLPTSHFSKRMLEVLEIVAALDQAIAQIRNLNPNIQIILTVSPVRYFAFGIEENTLSKSLLFIAIQQLRKLRTDLYYFPAYEIVMDELRDYRYFAEDMLHPNHQATRYVWEVLKETMIDIANRKTMDEVDEIVRAANHKPRNPHSEAHKQFISKYKEKILNLQERFPAMNFQSELHTLQSI